MGTEKKTGTVRKPNVFLYLCVAPFVKLYFRLIYRHRVDKSAITGIKPPYLVVAGHSTWLDYLISSVSMFPIRMNYVGAYNFFRNKLLKTVFTLMGVIPKHQFTSDIGAIKSIKYCIDEGRVVALYPHGCLSNEGRPGGYAVDGIAKLIKFLAVPVIAIQTDGGYLTRPRWSKKSRYGRMDTRVVPVMTESQIRDLSQKEIYKRLLAAINFDDYKWQRENMVSFSCRNCAEGVEYVLYKCPKCGDEFTLRSKGNRLYCLSCGNAVHMNRYLMFEPEAPDTVYYDGIDRWYDYQASCIDSEIERGNFLLEADTELLFAEPGKYGYQHQGRGRLEMTTEAITYTGTVQGMDKKILLPMKNIPMIPYAAGEYIEVAVGRDIHRFVLDNRLQIMKWVMAVRQIRDKFYEEAV